VNPCGSDAAAPQSFVTAPAVEPEPVLFVPLHVRRESNPQPPVLETGALPIELRTSSTSGQGRSRTADTTIFSRVLYQLSYLAVPTSTSDHSVAFRPANEKPAQRKRRGQRRARGQRVRRLPIRLASDRRGARSRPQQMLHGSGLVSARTDRQAGLRKIAGAGFEPATSGL
jgi:hypothetical protein